MNNQHGNSPNASRISRLGMVWILPFVTKKKPLVIMVLPFWIEMKEWLNQQDCGNYIRLHTKSSTTFRRKMSKSRKLSPNLNEAIRTMSTWVRIEQIHKSMIRKGKHNFDTMYCIVFGALDCQCSSLAQNAPTIGTWGICNHYGFPYSTHVSFGPQKSSYVGV